METLPNKYGSWRLIIVGLLLFIQSVSVAQRGRIILPSSTTVMDPNQDGFISLTNQGFSNDGYNVDEFEIPMFGIPIVGDGDALRDNQVGPQCGSTDLTVDINGYSAYMVKDANDNLIFRFRVGTLWPDVEAYTILIDTDGRIGPADPNSTPDNPGFEIDITFIKLISRGIYVYDIDGQDNCGTAEREYSFFSNTQVSIADVVSCSNLDYFYDFYVPFADLEQLFGITPSTELRVVALTNESATCALQGRISDVGGVDDRDYDGCNTCAFIDLAENQCPTAVTNLCESCEGFKFGFTPKPTIQVPLNAGQLEITGKAVPEASIFLDVYDDSGVLKEQDTVVVSTDSLWVATLTSPLILDDSVTARAQSLGKCRSGISGSDLSFAIVELNSPPGLSGTTTQLDYIENEGIRPVAPDLIVTDSDDPLLIAATISIVENFQPTEDRLDYTDEVGIAGVYDPATGVLELSGSATLALYQEALRSVGFENNSENPNASVRRIRIVADDGLDASNAWERTVAVVPVNDPPTVAGSPGATAYPGAAVTVDAGIINADLDNLQLAGATVSLTNNFLNAEDELLFTNQGGITGSYNAGTGVLSLSGSATLATYESALRSVQYRNNAGVPIKLTRQISFIVNDGNANSVPFNQFIVFSGENDPPVIVDENGFGIDTVRFSTAEDVILEACLDVVDPDGDPVILSGATSVTQHGTTDLTVGLCFRFTPDTNFFGEEVISMIVCDQGVPSLCDTAVVVITITPVNDPPTLGTLTVSVPENSTSEVCVTVTDPEGDPIIYSSATGSGSSTIGNGSSNADLCFEYTPPDGFLGDEEVVVTVCDQLDSNVCTSGSITVTVVEVNEPPETFVNGLPSDTLRISVPEDSTLVFCFEAVDPEGDDVILQNYMNVSGGGIMEVYDNIEFCFSFTPEQDFVGESVWHVNICDDAVPSLCGKLVAIIEVTPVNDPPVAVRDTTTVIRNSSESFNVLANDFDPDGDGLSLQVAAVQDPMHGTAQLESDGTVTYISDQSYQGVDSLVYRVCDDGDPSRCAEASLVIEVENLPVKAYEAVSPNGDGLNDYWRIESIDFYTGNLVRVYDRYNNLVFEMNGYDNGQNVWRGQANRGVGNRDLPEDTYFFTIYIGAEFPEPLSGFVLLKKN